MKLAIAGGRTYFNYDRFREIVDEYVKTHGKIDEIISGGAKGVDSLAERYANEHNITIKILKPEYEKYKNKRIAPLMRNTDIVNAATHLLALPTVNSVGTYDAIEKARKMKKNVTVIQV